MNYSDMITECASEISVPCKSYVQKGVEVHECNVNKVYSRKTGKNEGKYLTLFPSRDNSDDCVRGVIKNSLKKLLRFCGVHEGKLLVVGLGNENAVVDALGNEVTKRIRTGKIQDYYLASIAPKVEGVTGIKSFEIVKAVVESQRPDAVIAVDTLATGKIERLGNCYQLTTAGICPGGGVDNPQPCLNRQSLSVPVVAIGVPLIIAAGNITGTNGKIAGYAHYMLIPRDVDALIDNCARIIAGAVNSLYR